MIGGFNKLFRNISSIKGKNEFEKRLIKGTYTGDNKEPKEKHVVFMLECIKGKHIDLIRPKEATNKIFDRFFTNLLSISATLKCLMVLHRALQESDISQVVAHRIKEKESILYPCQKEDGSYETRMMVFVCDLYINYLKGLTNFIIICQLFQISLKDLDFYVRTLDIKELFLIFSRIDTIVEGALKIFEQRQFCLTSRSMQQLVFQVFVDLLKIYQSYYIIITYMLEQFGQMTIKDAKRALIIYLNFIKINKEIRQMAQIINKEFRLNLKIEFYDVDTSIVDTMRAKIEGKKSSGESKKRTSQVQLSQNTLRSVTLSESESIFQKDQTPPEIEEQKLEESVYMSGSDGNDDPFQEEEKIVVEKVHEDNQQAGFMTARIENYKRSDSFVSFDDDNK